MRITMSNFDFPTTGNVRVVDLLRLIYANRRHEYDMSGGGSGCRYWVYVKGVLNLKIYLIN